MFSWILAGVEYSLDDGTYCYKHGDSGLGMAPLHRLEERGPLQHGVTDRGYRLDPRVILLNLGVVGDSPEEVYQKRAQLLALFPPGGRGSLRWRTDSIIRQIDAFPLEGLDYSSQDRAGGWQKTVVAIKAPDPTWYDPIGEAITFELGGGGGAWTFPMSVPWTIGASSIDQSMALQYMGTAPVFPDLIRLIGPMTNPVIENLSTAEKLDFTGITIAAGDWYDIDLRYGHKTVMDKNGVNKIANLTNDSDLATFHIAAHPEAPGGTNSIRARASAITATTKIEIQYFTRYIGL